MLTAPYNGTTQVVAERNPYYAKVDTAGNQLPYFDRITIDVMQDTQAIILKAISGEIDMQNRFIETTDARTVIVQNQEKGGYGLFIARLSLVERPADHPQPDPQESGLARCLFQQGFPHRP